jgi:nitric oxide reductase subunit B
MAENKILFTRDDIVGGINVFQRYGLMEYGSVYGHGAYLGPDFTAEYLHNTSEFLIKAYSGAKLMISVTVGMVSPDVAVRANHPRADDP